MLFPNRVTFYRVSVRSQHCCREHYKWFFKSKFKTVKRKGSINCRTDFIHYALISLSFVLWTSLCGHRSAAPAPRLSVASAHRMHIRALCRAVLEPFVLGVDRLSAPILSILPIIDIGHFKNRFADNFFFFANKHIIYRWHYLLVNK